MASTGDTAVDSKSIKSEADILSHTSTVERPSDEVVSVKRVADKSGWKKESNESKKKRSSKRSRSRSNSSDDTDGAPHVRVVDGEKDEEEDDSSKEKGEKRKTRNSGEKKKERSKRKKITPVYRKPIVLPAAALSRSAVSAVLEFSCDTFSARPFMSWAATSKAEAEATSAISILAPITHTLMPVVGTSSTIRVASAFSSSSSPSTSTSSSSSGSLLSSPSSSSSSSSSSSTVATVPVWRRATLSTLVGTWETMVEVRVSREHRQTLQDAEVRRLMGY